MNIKSRDLSSRLRARIAACNQTSRIFLGDYAGNDTVTITLPLPPKALSPNARCHWSKKHSENHWYRGLTGQRAFDATGHRQGWATATVQTTFYHATSRRRDGDNLLASLKPAFDGLADGGLIANDSGLTHLPVIMRKDRDNPRVVLTVTRTDAKEATDGASPT